MPCRSSRRTALVLGAVKALFHLGSASGRYPSSVPWSRRSGSIPRPWPALPALAGQVRMPEHSPMPHHICTTCGTQYAASPAPPDRCPICEDERQYLGWGGQQWTTLDDLRADHENQIRTEEPSLIGIGTTPKFGIDQRALLIQSPGGNVVWDCISLIDAATIGAVNDLGGLAAIAISHPHYYSSVVEWSRAFGGVPIYLHADDREWVMRPDPAIEFWDGETKDLHDGLTLIRCG